jgi:hypothetical protein
LIFLMINRSNPQAHKKPIMKTTALLLGVAMMAGLTLSLPQAAAQIPSTDPGWPRVSTKDKLQLTVYQPQIDSWKDYAQLHYRCAISVKGVFKEERFGIAEMDASTVVDQAARVVAITPTKRELRFPDSSDAEVESLRKAVEEIHPFGRVITLSLDRLLAYVDPAQQPLQHAVEVNLDPPKIFHSSSPAILVMFMGEPEFKPVEKGRSDLMFGVNTNWDIFYDSAEQGYYLLNDGSWLTSKDVKGPWTPAQKLSKLLQTLPADENWADVRKAIPGKPAKTTPAVFVSTEPAELILTQGDPSFSPIPGTKLMRVANSDSALLMDSADGQFYLLVAGRWFRAKSLDGPWSAASKTLPPDFAKIPDGNTAAYVKASVPGTQDAQDAVMLASIPNTTTVKPGDAKLELTYDGEPMFVAIQGTSVQYAVNASETVFLVEGAYYSCSQGVWFTGTTASGPWSFCTHVPAAIYSIPASHPTHNVTYVTVQSSSPETVVYNQTSGYSGEYVSPNGVLMFGAGMLLGAVIADHYGHHYYPSPLYYSYGCGAVYHHGFGGYHSAARRYYGPYGGAGRITAYNPATGTYRRGAYAYGAAGSAAVRNAYNPYTGGYAQAARVNTRYGTAGRFYGEQGGRSVAGGYRTGAQGGVAGVKTGGGAGAVAWDTRNSQGAVVKGREGNVYAGKDGNVYKRDASGNWSSASAAGARPTAAIAKSTRATPSAAAARPAARPTPSQRPATSVSPSTRQSLDRDARARSTGNRPSAPSPSISTRSSSSFGGRSSAPSRPSGGGGRAGGGGRRR